MAKIAIMGYGTVGSGIYDIIKKNKNKLCVNTNGEPVEIEHILDIRDFDDHPEKEIFTKDFKDILNNKDISVIAEVMGGLHPAYEFTKDLLNAGKSVVTSNKELVATYGAELLEIARNNNVNYLFEASVGGGIPIIRPMHQCLTANNILRISGILNGTTNYILNQMIKNGKDFDVALKDAQSMGYAEKNPAADVEGYDACRKIAILASLAWRNTVDYNDIETEGITHITLDDVKYAYKMGGTVKLIGYAEQLEDGKIYSIVCPMIIKNTCPLSGVDDVFNAILVTGDCVGDVMFYGRGAGKMPTASAVVADIVDSIKHRERSKKIFWENPTQNIMAKSDDKLFRYFIRCNDSSDNAAKTFENCEFVEAINNETAFITEAVSDSEKEEKLGKLANIISCIRVMD